MKKPIFTFDGFDLIVFETPESAESFTEPYHVDVGQAFDADGQVLLFETDGRATWIRETGQLEPESLRTALLATLSQVGASVGPDADLDQLKRDAEERFRYVEPRSPLQWLRDLLRRHS